MFKGMGPKIRALCVGALALLVGSQATLLVAHLHTASAAPESAALSTQESGPIGLGSSNCPVCHALQAYSAEGLPLVEVSPFFAAVPSDAPPVLLQPRDPRQASFFARGPPLFEA